MSNKLPSDRYSVEVRDISGFVDYLAGGKTVEVIIRDKYTGGLIEKMTEYKGIASSRAEALEIAIRKAEENR